MPILINKSAKALCLFHNKKITHISIAVEQPLTQRAFCQDCTIPIKDIATMEQVDNLLQIFTSNKIAKTNPKINEKMIEFFQVKQMIQDELNSFADSLEKEIGNMICSEILLDINNLLGTSQIKLKELQKLGELLSSKFCLSGYDFSMKSKTNQQTEIFYVHQRTQFLQQILNQITSFRRQIQFRHSSTIQLIQPLQRQQSFLEPETQDKAHYVEQLLDNKNILQEQVKYSYTFSDLVYAKLSADQFREQIEKEKEQIKDLTNHINKMEDIFLKQIEILSKDTTTNELQQDLQTNLPDFDKYRKILKKRQNKLPELLKFQKYNVKPIILEGHLDEVHGIAINDSIIASGGADKTIRIWSLTEFKQIKELKGHSNWVITLAFSKDQNWLSSSAASPDNTILLWDLRTYTLRGQFTHDQQIHRQNFTPDSQFIVSACEDHSVYVWSIEERKVKLIIENNTSPVYGICIWENQEIIGSISSNGIISLNEFSSGMSISNWLAHTDGGCSIDISKDNTLLLSSGVCGLLKLWNWKKQEMIKQLQGHQDTVWTTLFLADPKTVISISCVGRVRIWDVQSGDILQEYMVIGGDDQYPQIVQSRNAKYLVGGGSNYSVKVWQLNLDKQMEQQEY